MTAMLTQTAIESEAEQNVPSENVDTQPGHRTNLRTKLSVFDDHSIRDLTLGYSFGDRVIEKCTSLKTAY